MKYWKTIARWLLRLVLSTSLLLLLLALAIQLPAVQNYLRQQLQSYLQTTLQTEVRIATLRLQLPTSLSLGGLHLETPRGDTLLQVDRAAVHFRLHQLLRQRIQFDQLELTGGRLDLYLGRDSSNIDFLTSAFAADTTAAEESPARPSPWQLTFGGAQLLLRELDLRYVDEKLALDLATRLGSLSAAVEQLDYRANDYQIGALQLRNTAIQLAMGTPEGPPTTAGAPTAFQVAAAQLDLEAVTLDYRSPSLALATQIEIGQLRGGSLHQSGDTLAIEADRILLDRSRLRYDQLPIPPPRAGFDPQHLDFYDLSATLRDFRYALPDLSADVQQFSARTADGFWLKELRSQVALAERGLQLRETSLTTSNLEWTSRLLQIDYPLLAPAPPPLAELRIDSDARLLARNLRDLSYFYPPLDSLDFFRQHRDRKLQLRLRAKGSLAELDLRSLTLRGLGLDAQLRGQLRQLDRVDQLALDLQLARLQTSGPAIRSWLPDSLLPAYVQLPDSLFARGSIRGHREAFTADVQVQTRRDTLQATTQFRAVVRARDIEIPDRAFLEVRVDTFVIDRADLLAYLPPDLLPPFVELPEAFILSGRPAVGYLDRLSSTLQLSTLRSGMLRRYDFSGDLRGLFSDQPELDLTLRAEDVPPDELVHFLPDSLLPRYLRLPLLNNIVGRFSGRPDDFRSTLRFASNTGDWDLNALRQGDAFALDLNVADLRTAAFFSDRYLDSLLGFSLQPLALRMALKGEGFDWSDRTVVDLDLAIHSAVDTATQGLRIAGQVSERILTARARATEPELALASELRLDWSTALPQLRADLQIDRLDLQALRLASEPFLMAGQLALTAEGTGLDTLRGRVRLDQWNLRYADRLERIDSLLLTVDLDRGKNDLRVQSDFLDGAWRGDFSIPRTVEILPALFYRAAQLDYPDTLVGATDDRFALSLHLHRPEVLTLGFIPTLEGLSPCSLAVELDNRQSHLALRAELPFVRYQASNFEELSLLIDGNQEGLTYELGLRRAEVRGIAVVDYFRTFGTLAEGRLTNTIETRDTQQRERFAFRSSLQRTREAAYELVLATEQLINYEKWRVPEGNRLGWSATAVDAERWRFSKGNSAIAIGAINARTGWRLSFEQFDLQTVSDIIKLDGDYFGGVLNGEISLLNVPTQPTFSAQLDIDKLVTLGGTLGDLKLRAIDEGARRIKMATSLRGNGNDLRLKGTLDLDAPYEALDFFLDLQSVNLAAIEPLSLGYLENMNGQLKGRLDITGNFSQPALLGELRFTEAAFDIQSLKARLQLGEQPVVFDANVIEFRDLEIRDVNGNHGVMSSYVLTSDYRNFFLQAQLNLQDFLVLNTTAKDNDLYYGKLIVDANATITGPLTAPTVELVTQAKKNSQLTYVYNPYSRDLESHEGVVEFVVPEELRLRRARQKSQLQEVSEGFNTKITVRAEVTDALDFKAITDPLSGDHFTGKAKGDVVFTLYPDGKMELNGQLTTVEGKYLFTYQKLVRRPFDVKPGGTLTWTGDPYNPDLDIDVEYRVRTSPAPLLANDTDASSVSTAKQVFLVVLNIGGQPSKTEISTSISYPSNAEGNTNDSEIEAAINNVNQDLSQQNTQAFALILFNGFLAQNPGNADFQLPDLSGNINNAISQQLNNLANRYIKFVEVDFGLDAYQTDSEQEQMDLTVSVRKRLFNDRLLIRLDGKASSETGPDQGSTQTFLDNVTVEYSLTPSGRFKLKFYNQRDFDDFIGGTALKVGGALVFSKDFNTWRWKKRQ